MTKQERVALAIKEVVSSMMNRVMDNVLIKDPFLKEKHLASKPLYAAFVPDEIFKGSHFERRFVTPFGNVWEKLAKVVAIEAYGNCLMGHTIDGVVGSESLRRIQKVLNQLEHNQKGDEKIKYIKKVGVQRVYGETSNKTLEETTIQRAREFMSTNISFASYPKF